VVGYDAQWFGLENINTGGAGTKDAQRQQNNKTSRIMQSM